MLWSTAAKLEIRLLPCASRAIHQGPDLDCDIGWL